jgi:hypothetical protein
MADGSPLLAPSTNEFVRRGGNLRLCLSEIDALSPPSAEDTAIADRRRSFLGAVLHRPSLIGRAKRSQRCATFEAQYVNAVVTKVGHILDAHTPEESLALGQMPTLIEDASFEPDTQLSLEDFAGNHLYVLIDTLLQEHVARRKLIDAYRKRNLTTRVLGNRSLRLSVTGSLFALSLAPKLGILPEGGDIVSQHIDAGLSIISAVTFGLDVPDAVRLKYLSTKHDKRTEDLYQQLASQQELSDLALRMAYSSTRYGGPQRQDSVTDRTGTPDKNENIRRFRQLNASFQHLNNDPGGKPYTGDQTLGYAARLLIERKAELAQIINPGLSPDQQEGLFLGLTRSLLEEDLQRMKKGLSVTPLHKALASVAGVVPAILFPGFISAAGDASSIGRDAMNSLSYEQRDDTDYS